MARLGSDRQRHDGQKRDVHGVEKYQNNRRTLVNVDRSQQIIARLEAGDQINSSSANSGHQVSQDQATAPTVPPNPNQEPLR